MIDEYINFFSSIKYIRYFYFVQFIFNFDFAGQRAAQSNIFNCIFRMIDEIIEHQFHQKEPSTSTSSSADHFDKNNLLLDALTQTTMLELMKTRKFKELWANMALLEQQEGGQSIEDEVANSNRTQSEGLSHSSIHFDPSNVGESIPQRISTPPSTNPLLIKTFRQLNQGLALAIETFIRGAQMAISCTSPVVRTFNQDAAQLYSVRIQLDRFTGCSHFRTAQFGLIVRGLLKLFKLFTTYISSPYFIENAHFFANGLLEMLAQFLEYISLFDEIDQCMDAHLFCQKIEDFEKIICQPLKRMLLKRQLRAKNSSSKSQKCFSKSIQCLDLAVKDSRVILLPLHHDTSPPAAEGNRSFLMAPELEYGRRKMFISGNISRRLKSIMREERRINIDEGNKPRNLTFRPSLSGKEREEFRNACKMAEEAIGEVSKYIER